METITTSVKKITITGADRLDPVGVFLENYGPGQGRITIICYGQAWTSFWGGMGDRTVEQFVASCNDGYLMDNLMCPHLILKKHLAQQTEYLGRIVKAVKVALIAELKPQDKP